MSLPEQYFSFAQPERSFRLAVLAVAAGTPVEAIAPLINRYLTQMTQLPIPYARYRKELMQALQIPSSPLVGKLLLLRWHTFKIYITDRSSKIGSPSG